MASTYEPIATTTLSSGASTITFSSISGSYTDLILVCELVDGGGYDIAIRFNSDTGSNYSRTYLSGNGTSAYSGRVSNQTYGYLSAYGWPDTGLRAINIAHIMNYSNSTTYKTIISRSNRASNGTDAVVNLWRSTSAITSITIAPQFTANNYGAGSTATLYGIKSA